MLTVKGDLLPNYSEAARLANLMQRYEHTFAVSEKVEGRIDFPLSLNMLPYTTNPDVRVDRSKYVYDLSTAVVHKGKLDAGHYYAYCRQGDQVSQRLCLLLSGLHKLTLWVTSGYSSMTTV